MGRYKVLIEKFVGLNPEKAVTRVEVTGYVSNEEPQLPTEPTISAENPVDVDGNLTSTQKSATPPAPVGTDEVVRLASFDITNPVARFVKIVTSPNVDSSRCVVWEAFSISKSLNEEKSIQILHRRKSAARVRSVSEATSVVGLNKTTQETGSDNEFEGIDSEEEQTMEPPISPCKSNSFRIDLNDLKNSDRITLNVDTERDLVDFEGGTTVVKILNARDENGNAEHPLVSEEEPPHSSTNEPSVAETVETNEVEGQAVTPDTPITMSVTVASDLMIFVELDNNFERIAKTADVSSQSLVEPDTVFYLPYQDVLLNGLPGTSRQTPLLPAYLKERTQPERLERKKILRKLILERLLAFGTPNLTALDITDTWYTGYVQHRALSYRVPKMRVESKEKTETKPNQEDGMEKVKPIQIKLGSKLPDSSGFIETFIYHANYFKGILNSATCSALECTFYLMIPHFKTQTDPNSRHLPGAGISTTFMKDWLYVLVTAAYQLKPSEPGAITDMVKKETKVLKSVILAILKEHKKMKERLRYIQDKVDIVKERTLDRVKLDPELATEIQNDEEPVDYAGFAHLQIVGFTGPEIFPKFLYFLTGKYGLFLKKEGNEAWFPFSDLNFLERRVMYLGLMDHVTSSFESVLTTIRHLEELYTPGYPMNLLTRFKPLIDLLTQPKPYQLLATESKLALYSAACGCAAALKRFRAVYKELIGMVKEAKAGLEKFDYSVGACAEFNAKLGYCERAPKINLIVPFATLNLEGFANLAQRGVSVPVDDIGK